MLVAGLHRRVALAEAEVLADVERLVAGELRRAGRDLGREAVDAAAEQAVHGAVLLGDRDALAEHRQATEGLLVAVVLGAVGIFGIADLLQAGQRIQAEHLGVALAGLGGDGEARGGGLVLMVELGDRLPVQVDAVGGVGSAGGERQREGREREEAQRTIRGLQHL